MILERLGAAFRRRLGVFVAGSFFVAAVHVDSRLLFRWAHKTSQRTERSIKEEHFRHVLGQVHFQVAMSQLDGTVGRRRIEEAYLGTHHVSHATVIARGQTFHRQRLSIVIRILVEELLELFIMKIISGLVKDLVDFFSIKNGYGTKKEVVGVTHNLLDNSVVKARDLPKSICETKQTTKQQQTQRLTTNLFDLFLGGVDDK